VAKLTKVEAKAHQQACEILEKDVLSVDDKLFVLQHWQESAKHINTIAGAFFTPIGLAGDLSVEICGTRIIDLCAGIGSLAFWAVDRCWGAPREIVCVELNPEYAAVGRKIVPEARWVVGSVFDLPADLGHFDCAIGNPPFGATPRDAKGPRFTGKDFELHVIDVASDLADHGAFIVPQKTAGFKYSSCPAGGWPSTIMDGVGSGFEATRSETHDRLLSQTGIRLEPSCGIDTGLYARDWHGVSVTTEVVTVDFIEARTAGRSLQGSLFSEAA
jgi:predicted RNA methylase